MPTRVDVSLKRRSRGHWAKKTLTAILFLTSFEWSLKPKKRVTITIVSFFAHGKAFTI
jgi:hypothetical protein